MKRASADIGTKTEGSMKKKKRGKGEGEGEEDDDQGQDQDQENQSTKPGRKKTGRPRRSKP